MEVLFCILRFCRHVKNIIKSEVYCLFKSTKKMYNFPNNNVFIFTHGLGGGTGTFVNNYTKEIQKNGKNPIIIFPINHFLRDIYFYVHDINNKKRFYVTKKELLNSINSSGINQIIINSLVSYHNVVEYLDYFIMLKEKKHYCLITMVHDYFMICPNYNLTYKREFFCGLNCNKYKCKLISPFTLNKIRIEVWRSKWHNLLLHSDEIRVFDSSSEKILAGVYPDVKSFVLKPHSLEYIKYTPIDSFFSEHMNIGVVGDISRIKGKKIVLEVAKQLKKTKDKMYILGSCKAINRNIIHTGRYKQSELGIKLQKYKINVILFPSICPETFSYVISELVALDVPIVCFDFGAQANKLRNYHKGRICSEVSANAALSELKYCYKNFVKK